MTESPSLSHREAGWSSMVLLVYLLQPLIRQMRINLRGRYARVAQHFLYRADVGAVSQQLGGERVAQRVRRHFLDDAGARGRHADDAFDGLRFQPPVFAARYGVALRPVGIAQKNRFPVVGPALQIVLEMIGRLARQEHDPRLAAL